MSKDMISQEEIDALLKKSSSGKEDGLSDKDKDMIGEIGNISMSTAATTLSEILNKKVSITTPRVTWEGFKDILEEMENPKLVAVVDFKEGLTGNNIFMLEVGDAAIIADLMMGGDGVVESNQMTELEQSAVAEAMNQMIGSASTSMATLVGKGVDINPPKVTLWDAENEVDLDGIDTNTKICKIEFDMEVEGLIKSKIMQFFKKETIEEIVESVESETKRDAEQANKKKACPDKKQDADYGTERGSISVEPIQTPKPPAPKRQPTSEPTRQEPVTVQKPIFNDLEPDKFEERTPRNLDLIMDVPLEFSVVLGKSKKTIKDILSFGSGSIIELNKQADEALEIYVNGKLIAQGEVVVINENFGIRITNILSKEQRIRGL